MDLRLVQAAREVYEVHRSRRPDLDGQMPHGVAVHRKTLRGELIYSDYPVLLPNERFIPLYQLEIVAAS